jgi:hypothetical protein
MLTILQVLEEKRVTRSWRKYKQILCKCDCWKEIIKDVDLVRQWVTKSCGCLIWISNITHWLVWHPIYNAWEWMKKRCNSAWKNWKNISYIWITYSKEWEKFENFYNDMFNTWFEWAELDKDILCNRLWINPKIYSKETCIWVTRKMNSNNRSSSVIVEYMWRKKSIKAWADELSINPKLLYHRISDYWWTIEKAFNTKTREKIKMITYKWETNSVKYFADKFWIKYRTLSDRLSKWISVEQAIESKLQRWSEFK